MSNTTRLIRHWKADPGIASNIVNWHTIPGKMAKLVPFPDNIPGILQERLRELNIFSLYTHQAAAWSHIQNGDHLVVITGTASGKSFCYNLPVLSTLLEAPDARALYLFPTKALAQDQLNKINDLTAKLSADHEFSTDVIPSVAHSFPSISPAIYDGDTPTRYRPNIRNFSRLIISNPDMLHTGILPHHTSWAKFFQNLSYVVLDEIHVYRGVFGSHVANVIRRLKRIARFYGSNPQFILTSATIANPLALAEKLIEYDTTRNKLVLIDDDGSARGPKEILFYNPPIINQDLGLRRSAILESIRLGSDLIDYNIQTVLFCRSRKTVELLLTYLREQSKEEHSRDGQPNSSTASEKNPKNNFQIRGYRSGYLSKQRREIEQGLRTNQVRAVVATNALELGIDIGGMEAALLVGFPGTIAAAWQQMGRAGRTDEPSLAILVTTADPIDQYLAAHPEYFYARSPEQALVNPNNLIILLAHIKCAAFELPFQSGESFGNLGSVDIRDYLEYLLDTNILYKSKEMYYWMSDEYPAQAVSLRSTTSDTVLLQINQENPQIIGKIDRLSANWMVHPNAIYLHEGQTYFVDKLELDAGVASLNKIDSDYYTEHQTESSVNLIQQIDDQEVTGGNKYYGEISVIQQVVGYRMIRWHTHEQLGTGQLMLPPTELQTIAYWLSIADETVEELLDAGFWSNEKNDYGQKWSSIRETVRKRDGYLCQVCGIAEGGRKHDVHHKIPFRSFVNREQANHLDNLVTLCPNCHKRAETAVRIRSGLAGLGYAVRHLAPLFLMCDPRDIGVHTDPQSNLADGAAAVIVYDQVPAGIGFSQRLYEIHNQLILHTYQLVHQCPCNNGCPSCVGPGGEFGAGGKQETLALLVALIPPA